MRSDLRFPEPVYEALSIYLLLAIGLKGGVELSHQPLSHVALPALFALFAGFALPFILFPVLRHAVGLVRSDAASVAAHYGYVSVVTFAIATAYLQQRGIPAESFMPVLLALMEAPGIIAGVLLGSGSYIAAPAAMSMAVPEANPALGISAALAVTFPFNVFINIPLLVLLGGMI